MPISIDYFLVYFTLYLAEQISTVNLAGIEKNRFIILIPQIILLSEH